MAQITTTTRTDPVRYPGTRTVDRSPATGHLWFVMLDATGASIQFWRSANAGATWSNVATFTPGVTVLELGGLRVDHQNRLYVAYRTNESSQDRVYLKAATVTTAGLTFLNTVRLAAVANGGSAGSIYQGMDLIAIRYPDGRSTVAVGAGTTNGAQFGVELFGVTIASAGQPVLNNAVIANKRKWLVTGSGRITPTMGYELSPAHMWVTFGRTAAYAVKAPWGGSGWTGPANPVKLSTASTGYVALDSMSGTWCSPGWVVPIPNPADNTTVLLHERNQANTKTTDYVSPVHPAGAVRHCAVTQNVVTRDVRVYAVGTSTGVLYHCDFIRASATWSGWSTTAATAILGANADNYSVRGSSLGSARYDVVTAHAGSPNTVVHTSQTLTYAPFAPTWVLGSTTNSPATNGAAANVGAALDLVWDFDDPDPADVQSAWALSRQIGAGALAYFRASDSTWQAAEVKNTGATPSRTLAASWGLTSDPNHTYRVKVWDGSDTASVYSAALAVVPSGPVDPTITSPTPEGVTWTTDTVTVQWTVAEQTAYRVQLEILGGIQYDSGWLAGTDTSHTIPTVLVDGINYTIRLQTRNLEGLPSSVVSRNISVDYIDPPQPTLVATPMPTLGLTRVVISNPAPSGGQPAVLANDLQRRDAGVGLDTSTDVTIARGIPVGGTWDDWTARSGKAYEYRALARGANGTTGYSAWTA